MQKRLEKKDGTQCPEKDLKTIIISFCAIIPNYPLGSVFTSGKSSKRPDPACACA
jgi:hypothetical protein